VQLFHKNLISSFCAIILADKQKTGK